jgi:hypothetical protein
MPTFVLRFIGDPMTGYRGRVRHVGTGEETTFSNLEELLAFLDQMNALPYGEWDTAAWDSDSPEVGGTADPSVQP